MAEARGYCRRCDREYPPDMKFCMVCGEQLVLRPQVEATAGATCPQCGSPVQEGAKFCLHCGARLPTPQPPYPQAGEISPPMASEPAPAVASSQCPRCGASVQEGWTFCMACGARLDGREPEAPAIVPPEVEKDESKPATTAPTPPHTPGAPLSRTGVESPAEFPVPTIPRISCPQCQAEVEVEMAFCLFCGAPLTAPSPVESPKVIVSCPHCGAQMGAEDRTCAACGWTAIPEEPTISEEEKAEVATTKETVEVTTPCPQCGSPINVGSTSCDACGYGLVARPKRVSGVWRKRVAWFAAILVVIGVGGWSAYRYHAPTRAAVNGVLFRMGLLASHLVVISSPPECQVVIDGEAQGVTDAEGRLVIRVSRGSHVLRLARDGYEAVEQSIEVMEPEMTVTVALTPRAPEGMVFIPGGTFRMGRDDGDEYERPAHEVTVAPFFLDRTEVTNAQYYQFIRATGHPAPPHWTEGTYPLGQEEWPVTQVSWSDADAYCRWAGKRLPTEEEWEFAARGTDGRLYPWGNRWEPNAANAATTSRGTVAPVGSFPQGESPFKALDMVGNVWEWTASVLRAYPGGHIPEETLPESELRKLKVIRGGCYLSSASQATATYRMGWPEQGADYAQTGFRCAKDVRR